MILSPLPDTFGAHASDVDLTALSDDGVKKLLMALYENHILVIETGGLATRDYVTFAQRLGEPITLSRDAEFPEIQKLTNVEVDTVKDKKGAAHWHTDQSFRETVSSITVLYSVRTPASGGETQFCNLAAAYEELDDTTKDLIDDLVVEHRHGISISARPGDHTPIPPRKWDPEYTAFHPLVRQHPVTGQKTLYAISGTPYGIRGMSQKEATQLLNRLCDHAFQDRFLTQHRLEQDCILMWDNPTVLHSATPIAAATGPDDTRIIHRVSLRGMPGIFPNPVNDGWVYRSPEVYGADIHQNPSAGV